LIYRAIVTYRVFPDPEKGLPKPMEVEFTAHDDHEALAQLWERFNHAFPGVTGDLAEKFRVRSMCVGDEIKLALRSDPDVFTTFVVAPMGFDLLVPGAENEYAKPGGLWNPAT
jgi:hypothetical protein